MRNIFSLIVVFILIGLGIDTYNQKTTQASPQSHIAMAPVVDEVIVYAFGLPMESTITPAEVEAGKYPIEAIEVAPNQYIIDRARRYGGLTPFDNTLDGTIDMSDVNFARFSFGYLNPDTRIIHFVPMTEVGVRAIIIDPRHLKLAKYIEDLPPGYWISHSMVIMVDGSTGYTYHVPIPASFLRSLKTEPGSNQTLIMPLG